MQRHRCQQTTEQALRQERQLDLEGQDRAGAGQGRARAGEEQGKKQRWHMIYLDQRGDNASQLANIAAHIHSVYDEGAQLPRAQPVLHHQARSKPQYADDTACVALPAWSLRSHDRLYHDLCADPVVQSRKRMGHGKRGKREKFMLFSDHNGSLLRRQPRAMTTGHSPKEKDNS